MKITASIIDYLGKYEGGILVSIGLMCNEEEYHDAIFYYTEDQMIINPDEEFKEKWGDIENTDIYFALMESLINQVKPYEDIWETLEDVQEG